MRQAVVLTLFCSLQMPAVVEASPSVPQQGQTKGSDFSTTPASVRGWADRVTAKDPKVRASADADLVQGVPRSLPLLRRFLDSQDEALHAVIPRPRALSRGSITASPVFADGRVFVAMGQSPGHGNGPSSIHAISPNGQGDVTTSRLLWSSREVGRVVGTPNREGRFTVRWGPRRNDPLPGRCKRGSRVEARDPEPHLGKSSAGR
jgi:hypothetical protein